VARKLVRKRDEGTGRCRKPYNGELHNLYSSLNIVRMVKSGRMENRVVGMQHAWGKRIAYKVMVGKPETEGRLGRGGCR
jgi:hypothetical protein